MEFGGAQAIAGGSDMTKVSSSAKVGQPKKVLQFRLFKTLKKEDDLRSKYQVGRVLGKGSFGEVRECIHT